MPVPTDGEGSLRLLKQKVVAVSGRRISKAIEGLQFNKGVAADDGIDYVLLSIRG